jgi:hypothetical protein
VDANGRWDVDTRLDGTNKADRCRREGRRKGFENHRYKTHLESPRKPLAPRTQLAATFYFSVVDKGTRSLDVDNPSGRAAGTTGRGNLPSTWSCCREGSSQARGSQSVFLCDFSRDVGVMFVSLLFYFDVIFLVIRCIESML